WPVRGVPGRGEDDDSDQARLRAARAGGRLSRAHRSAVAPWASQGGAPARRLGESAFAERPPAPLVRPRSEAVASLPVPVQGGAPRAGRPRNAGRARAPG